MSIHINIGKGSKYYDAPDCEDGDEECFKMYEEKRHKEDCMDITKKCEQEKEELMRQNEQLKDNDGMLSQALAGKTTEIEKLKREETSCKTQNKILAQKVEGLQATLKRVSPSSVSTDISNRFPTQFGQGVDEEAADKKPRQQLQQFIDATRGSGTKTSAIIKYVSKAIQLRVGIMFETQLSSDNPPVIPENELDTHFFFEIIVKPDSVDLQIYRLNTDSGVWLQFVLATISNEKVEYHVEENNFFSEFCFSNVYFFDSIQWILDGIVNELNGGSHAKKNASKHGYDLSAPLSTRFINWQS